MSDDNNGISPERMARIRHFGAQMQNLVNRLLCSEPSIKYVCEDARKEAFVMLLKVEIGAVDTTVADPKLYADEEINLRTPAPQVVTSLPGWMKDCGIKEDGPTARDLAQEAIRQHQERTNPELDRQQFRTDHDRRSGGRPPIPGIRTERPMETAPTGATLPHYHIVVRDEDNRIIHVAKPIDWELASMLVSKMSQDKEHFRHRITLQPGRCQGDHCPKVERLVEDSDVARAQVASQLSCEYCVVTIDGAGKQHHEDTCPKTPYSGLIPHWAMEAAKRISSLRVDDMSTWTVEAAASIAQEFFRMQQIIFYGPHCCDLCGLGLIARGDINGGHGHLRFDYPDGPIYPNQPWRTHRCHAFKVTPDGYFGTQPVTGDGQDYEPPRINRAPGQGLGPARPSQPYSSNASSQPDGHVADDRN